MSNKYYRPGEERAAKVNDLFAIIARRYDIINDLQSLGLHRVWKRKVVKLANVKPGDRALDLCCGTGDISFGLAEAGADVVGLDFSEDMLAVAENRKRQKTISPQSATQVPQFVHGDAQNLAFPDA